MAYSIQWKSKVLKNIFYLLENKKPSPPYSSRICFLLRLCSSRVIAKSGRLKIFLGLNVSARALRRA